MNNKCDNASPPQAGAKLKALNSVIAEEDALKLHRLFFVKIDEENERQGRAIADEPCAFTAGIYYFPDFSSASP